MRSAIKTEGIPTEDGWYGCKARNRVKGVQLLELRGESFYDEAGRLHCSAASIFHNYVWWVGPFIIDKGGDRSLVNPAYTGGNLVGDEITLGEPQTCQITSVNGEVVLERDDIAAFKAFMGPNLVIEREKLVHVGDMDLFVDKLKRMGFQVV